MLNSLRGIIQDVTNADDLSSALGITVQRVKEIMGTEVCSIYLADVEQDDVLHLMATEGLNKSAEGQVHLPKHQGLVGLVAEREEPLNLEDAPAHKRYQYFPETGEEKFKSFLGAPIIHQRHMVGVLVVQQSQQRRFDESEEAFLVTIAAQLAAIIDHAQASGSLQTPGKASAGNVKFIGVAGAPGIAIGRAEVVMPKADLASVPSKRCYDIAEELEFFNRCLASVRSDMRRLGKRLATELPPQEQALFDVYLAMLDDNALGQEVSALINQGEWAQGAVSQVIMQHVRTFEKMEDLYFKERAVDVKDLGLRVLAYLQKANPEERIITEPVILVGEELTASMLAEVPVDKLVGLVSVRGSSNSHVAILARSMGIPSVMGVDLPLGRLDGYELICDGYNGAVLTNVSERLRKRYQDIFEEEKLITRGLEALKDLPCQTQDGHRIPLLVNTGLMADIARSLDKGAEGVGLYRTEVPFLLKDRFPSEEEQRQIYRSQLEAFHPRPVTMRTLDVGGDKALPYFPIEEENPFLGWRGIRVTLDHPEIFLVQVRAMLKASEGLGNLRILLPMISNLSELEEAQALIGRAHTELLEEGWKLDLPPIGVMIEVPSAVYQARQLARRADFLSVGSNDLTQYLLAVDRNNSRVADLYHIYHPAVLMACSAVAEAAKAEEKPLSICGELAGDPGAAVLLMAMGYGSLSMNATNLPKVKSVIRFLSMSDAQSLLAKVLLIEDALEIKALIDNYLAELGIAGPVTIID